MLTPMSYYTWDYSFGQGDKDSLRRAQVDSIYLQVQSTMNQLAQRGADVSQISTQLRDTDAKYNQMDYQSALTSVQRAESTANNMMSSSQGMIQQIPNSGSATYLILAASLGILVGVALAWLLVKKAFEDLAPEHANEEEKLALEDAVRDTRPSAETYVTQC